MNFAFSAATTPLALFVFESQLIALVGVTHPVAPPDDVDPPAAAELVAEVDDVPFDPPALLEDAVLEVPAAHAG